MASDGTEVGESELSVNELMFDTRYEWSAIVGTIIVLLGGSCPGSSRIENKRIPESRSSIRDLDHLANIQCPRILVFRLYLHHYGT